MFENVILGRRRVAKWRPPTGFFAKLTVLRLAERLEVADLARLARVDVDFVEQVESGHRFNHAALEDEELLRRLAVALKYPVNRAGDLVLPATDAEVEAAYDLPEEGETDMTWDHRGVLERVAKSASAARLGGVLTRQVDAERETRRVQKSTGRLPELGSGHFESVFFPQPVARAPRSAVAKSAADAEGDSDEDDGALAYRVFRRRVRKAADGSAEERYTLGVMASVDDGYEDLEEACWGLMRKSGEGQSLLPLPGAEGRGEVVESYINRAPDYEVGGQTVRQGDWLVGAIWTPDAWAAIKNGGLVSYGQLAGAR